MYSSCCFMHQMLLLICAAAATPTIIVDPDEEWWSIDLDSGSDITLNCTEGSLPAVENWQNMTWVLPDMTLMPRGAVGEFVTPDGLVKMAVVEDGQLLHITNIQEDYFGLYYCVVFSDEHNFFVTRRGINMEWSYKEEIWHQYQTYVVIIGITAGLFAAMAIVIAVVALWCKRSAERDDHVTTTTTTTGVVKMDLTHVIVNNDATSAVRSRAGKTPGNKESPNVSRETPVEVPETDQ